MLRQTIYVAIALSLSAQAHAQQYAGAYVNAGVGLYGGAAGCGGSGGDGTGVEVPEGVQDVLDEIDDLRAQQRELKKEKAEIKKELSAEKNKQTKYEGALNSVLETNFANAVIQNARNHFDANDSDVNTMCADGGIAKEELAKIPTALGGDYNCNMGGMKAGVQGWNALAREAGKPGAVSGNICAGQSDYTRTAYDGDLRNNTYSEKKREDCKNGAMELVDVYDKITGLTARLKEIEQLETDIRKEITAKGKDKRQAEREAREDARNGYGDTEADDTCRDCNRYRNAPKISTTDKVISIVGGALGGYLQYRGGKYIADQNAQLGWPTSPYLAYGMGAGPLMAGIYGATYGGGVGGFGCNGGAAGPYGMYGPGGLYGGGGYPNMGGAFGYPTAWGGGAMGGGLYNGMGPWGMPGPWGGGGPMGGGVPMVGFIASGIAGAIGGGMMPMSGGMVPMSGGMMMPYASMPYASMPYASTPYASMPYASMPYSSMPYASMPYANNGMDMNMSMQYQQMMMQQQQQQMSIMMQQQQQQMANQQVKSRLYMDMMRIQSQISQIDMGFYSGSYSNYGTGGQTILPYPGNNSTYNGFLNGSSYSPYSGSTTVPATTGTGISGRGTRF